MSFQNAIFFRIFDDRGDPVKANIDEITWHIVGAYCYKLPKTLQRTPKLTSKLVCLVESGEQ